MRALIDRLEALRSSVIAKRAQTRERRHLVQLLLLSPSLFHALLVPLLALHVHLVDRKSAHALFLQKLLVLQETVESLANRGEWAAAVSRTGAWWRGKAARSFLQGFAAG